MTTGVSSLGLERAITLVRTMVAVLGGVTLFSTRIADSDASTASRVLVVLAVSPVAVGLAVLSRRLGQYDDAPPFLVAGMQALDTMAFVAMAIALEAFVADGAWALLVIPMVVASLRLNDLAVVGTWVLGSGGYLIGSRASLFGDAISLESLTERVAVLLAVAVSLALLTRWLQEGWRAQREMTANAEMRSHRLLTIERAARTMRESEPDDVMRQCLAHLPQLGFTAGSTWSDGTIIDVVGDGSIVPDEVAPDTPESNGVLVTSWAAPNNTTVQSATVIEANSGTIVSGWLDREIDDSLARCLWDMVASAGSAVEATTHLAKARFDAEHDPLTGLANRAELDKRLEVEAAKALPKALLFIDLDNFKATNDEHGHLIADEILIALADRIRDHVSGRSLAARFGGDEFVVLLTGDPATVAMEIAEQIRQAVATPFHIDDHQYSISASIGVALSHEPVSPEELLTRADQAAYEAKDSGRDAVHMASRYDSGRRHDRSSTPGESKDQLSGTRKEG